MNGVATAFSSLWWRGFGHLPSTHYHHRDDSIAQRLIDAAAAEPEALLKQLGTTSDGLTAEAAAQRLSALGPNLVAHDHRQHLLRELVGRARNPLNFLLLSLAALSYFLGDRKSTRLNSSHVAISYAVFCLKKK